jgi:serine/threonine protein kinase
MSREPTPSAPSPAAARTGANVELETAGDAALVTVSGLVDERFAGFGDVGPVKTMVLHVAQISRMTSFGVRQWLKAMEELPKTITDLYLLGCPTFFVDQLNMVLNFGGGSKVLTVLAPYVCPNCGAESGEVVDVLAQRATIAREPPEKQCARCGAKLEFDETPESYFAFAAKYGAKSLHPSVAELLSSHALYSSVEGVSETPPRIIKLVHGPVTYFRIIGTIGTLFRARPLLVGSDGEVVIDLAEVDRFEPTGHREWRRLIKTLAQQVPAITLVDVPPSFLDIAGDTLLVSRNIAVASLLAPYVCLECARTSPVSVSLATMVWPPTFEDHVCPTCGEVTRNRLAPDALAPLQKASTLLSAATQKVVEHRDELLSRAVAGASAAAGGNAAVATDDMILGKYKIVRPLSAGGMAEVFVAKQVGIGGFEKPVAIKRIQNKLLESRNQAIELFLNEAKIAGRLMHPNIVQVLDVGQSGGALYLAMEYVHGKDLRDVLKTLNKRRVTMPLPEALYVVREVAQALDYAYWSTDMAGRRLNVVHRDVSPHNVILGYDGTVKLLDFGVAMSAITEHEQALIVGKWTYMSPETTMNGHADHRSDLFSLGVVLYLLCSGVMPFGGNDPKEIVRKIRAGDYRQLEEIAPQVPPRVTELVARMLSPNPDLRPQRGQQVVTELNELVREYSLESSGQRIADFLLHNFRAADPGSVKELVRAYPDDTPSMAPTNISSLTPSSRTSRAHKISESFPRVTESVRLAKESSTPPPLTNRLLEMRRDVGVDRRRTRDSVVNLGIVIAIIFVVVLGAYLMISNY